MGQHTAPWDKHTLIRQLTAPSRSASPLWTPRLSESGECKSTPTKVSQPRFVESLASSGEASSVQRCGRITGEFVEREWRGGRSHMYCGDINERRVVSLSHPTRGSDSHGRRHGGHQRRTVLAGVTPRHQGGTHQEIAN